MSNPYAVREEEKAGTQEGSWRERNTGVGDRSLLLDIKSCVEKKKLKIWKTQVG